MGIPVIEPYAMPQRDDLPEDVVSWTVDPGRAVLLIHDMQKYFLSPFPEKRSPILELVRNVALLRRACVESGVPVAYTAQPGGMTDEERGLLKDFWGPGMTVAPEQRAIADEVAPGSEDRIFTKWRYSAFHRTGLLDYLRKLGRDQLVVCGVYAHVGCLMTACDAFTHDIQPFLVADAIADFSSANHEMALAYAAQRCAATPPTEAVLAALGSGGRVVS
ncbi:isochorismatase family protein (plasmid) [Embleya sp. NBC_00888]|uniref:isochorismatase family protein n=1 Tax=Embleya sp. NBC_00888 TaxID=2975960 RepID=UPI002F90FE58|nr:isochorismatase family protein [Embleya sp. NBC_00888]